MSTLKVNNLQVGQDSTATNNLTWFQPGSPDGTIRLGSGNAGSATTKFTFDKDGNLTCVGDITANSIIAPIEGTLDDWIVHAGDTNTKFGFPAADTFSVETSGNSRLYIKSDGKIGINTTTPNSALEVQGDGGVNDATITFTRLGSPSNGSVIGSNFYRIGTDSVAGMGAYRESAMDDAYLAFHTQPTGGNFTERLRITSDGKVGINEDVPQSTLHVASASNYVDIGLSNSTSGHTGSDGANIFYNSNLELALWNRESASIRFATAGLERARIDGSGHATFKRSFNLDSSSDNHNIREGRSWTWTSNGTSSGTVRGYLYGDSSGHLRLGSGGWNERLRIHSGGQVSIGGGGSPAQVGDGQLIVYSSDRLHPAIKCAGQSNNYANGWTLLGDNYQADESQVNIGVSYSSSSLVLSRCCKVSGTADNTYLSSQDSYNARPTALVLDNDGALRFHTTETNATTTTDSAVSLTEVFKIDKVGNIYQRIRSRYLFMGDNNQLKLGVGSSGDPVLDAVSGDLMIKNSDTTIAIVRGTYLQMLDDIRFNAGKGVNFINNTDTATGETVSSSVLDEYEEGDWTPSNAHLTVNNVYSARYIKVGRIVHLSFAISFAASPADTAQTAWIDGLPFQSHNKAQYVTLDWVGTSSSAAYRNTNTEHVIFANTSRITFYYPTGAHAQTRSHVAGKQVRGTFTYLASA